jgi:hypothetical protein
VTDTIFPFSVFLAFLAFLAYPAALRAAALAAALALALAAALAAAAAALASTFYFDKFAIFVRESRRFRKKLIFFEKKVDDSLLLWYIKKQYRQ